MNSTQLLPDVLVFAQSATPWVENPNMLGAILGTGVGIFGALYGTMAGMLAPRGKGRSLVMGMHWVGIALGAGLLALALIALFSGQPYLVWYCLGLPGLILTGVLLPMTGIVKQRYREAEQRRVEAENFRRG